MPDADLDNAVNALMGAAYGSCGERCMAISVVVAVGDAVADALVGKLKPKSRRWPSANARGLDMGPLVTGVHRDKVRSYIDLGAEEGAELVVDGRGLKVASHDKGFFLGGTLFDHVKALDADLPGRDLRPGARGGAGRQPAAGDRPHRRPRVRQRHLRVHRDGAVARHFSDSVQVGMVG